MARMPIRLLYLLARFLYFIIYYIIPYRKKVVLDNLKLAFPDKDLSNLLVIRRNFYKHFADLIIEGFFTLGPHYKSLHNRFKITNPEVFEQAFKQKQHILLLCGHYANWEWSGVLTPYMPHHNYAVYKKLQNPYIDNFIKRLRSRFGAKLIPNSKIAKVLLTHIKREEPSVTLVLSDQNPDNPKITPRASFMGVEVPVINNTEILATKLKMAVYFLDVTKTKRGYYSATVQKISDDASQTQTGKITREYLDLIENQIKTAPELYLWTHKRWKHRHKNLQTRKLL